MSTVQSAEAVVHCCVPGCQRSTKTPRRGRCGTCYQRLNRERKKAGLSWEDLEATGEVPQRKLAESAAIAYVEKIIDTARRLKDAAGKRIRRRK